MRMADKLEKWLTAWKVLLALGVIAGVCYAPALFGGFVYDDHLQVSNNPSIRTVLNFPEFFRHPSGYYSQSPASYYRPVHMAVYSLVYLVFKDNPLGYHLLNVLLAIFASWLLFLILQPWFSRLQAGLAALIFTVLPAHVEAVAWIAALPEVLGALLIFWVFKMHQQEHWDSPAYGLAGMVFLLALLTREHALVLPLLAMLLDALDSRRHENFVRWRLYWRYGVYALAIAIYFWLRFQTLGYWVTRPEAKYPMSGEMMFVNAAWLLAQYLWAFLFPPPGSAFHVFTPVASLWEIRMAWTALTLTAYGGVAAWLYKRNMYLFFFSLWIPAAFLPFMYFPALGENLMVDRYMFLPSAGAAVLFSAAGIAAYRRLTRPLLKKAALLLGAGIIIFWAGLSFARCFYWFDDVSLYRKTIASDPHAYHFYNLLAQAYYQQGDWQQAEENFQALDRLFPGKKTETVDYADVAQLSGSHRHYKKAFFEAQIKMAAVCFHRENYDRALEIYEKLLAVRPLDAELHYYAGSCQQKLGREAKARNYFQKAAQLNPSVYAQEIQPVAEQVEIQAEVERLCTLAREYVREQKYTDAVQTLHQAIGLDPGQAKPYHFLFNVYWLHGEKGKAREAIYQALQRDPQNALYRYNYEALQKKP
ncbi:tetratricopeptide repeat protein [candidate division FCPU426 bacterium]|nr:tetratricopeptide repeat protein [candidate division FCPU426 bacterium]